VYWWTQNVAFMQGINLEVLVQSGYLFSNSQAFLQVLKISLKTTNVVLLQPAEIADRRVFS